MRAMHRALWSLAGILGGLVLLTSAVLHDYRTVIACAFIFICTVIVLVCDRP